MASIKGNNPGNIRRGRNAWRGEVASDRSFANFSSLPYGYRALFGNLWAYRNKYGLRSLRKMIDRWAPASDGNDPRSYAEFVARRAGIGVDDELDFSDADRMIRVASAMTRIEHGSDASLEPIKSGYNLFKGDFDVYNPSDIDSPDYVFSYERSMPEPDLDYDIDKNIVLPNLEQDESIPMFLMDGSDVDMSAFFEEVVNPNPIDDMSNIDSVMKVRQEKLDGERQKVYEFVNEVLGDVFKAPDVI